MHFILIRSRALVIFFGLVLALLGQYAMEAPAHGLQAGALVEYVVALDERQLRLAQSRLRDLGLYEGAVHGQADEETFVAILSFHRSHPGPLETLLSRIRQAVTKNNHMQTETDLHFDRAEQGEAPLCLDFPGRDDCAGGS